MKKVIKEFVSLQLSFVSMIIKRTIFATVSHSSIDATQNQLDSAGFAEAHVLRRLSSVTCFQRQVVSLTQSVNDAKSSAVKFAVFENSKLQTQCQIYPIIIFQWACGEKTNTAEKRKMTDSDD